MYTLQYTSRHLMSSVLTIRISDEMKHTLQQLATVTGRSKSFLAFEAIQQYLEQEAWQLQETQKALAEADQGLFATEEDLGNLIKKWQKN